MRQNRVYYDDMFGYVCDCRPSTEPYEKLCYICQQYVDIRREEDEDEQTEE